MLEALQQEQVQAPMVGVVPQDRPGRGIRTVLLGPLLAPLAGQGAGQAVLASQDPQGTPRRPRAKGEQKGKIQAMDSLIWGLTPASQGSLPQRCSPHSRM